jgi:hypothetical protein
MDLLVDLDPVIIPDQHFIAKCSATTSAHNAAIAVAGRAWRSSEKALKDVYLEQHQNGDFDASCQRSFPQAVWTDGSKAAVVAALARLPAARPDDLPDLEGAVWREYNAAARAARPIARPPETSESVSLPLLKALAATVDEGTLRIAAIGQDKTKDLERRMQEIIAIDRRALGWSSPKWAGVLDLKSDSRVRQLETWKNRRRMIDMD